MLAEKQHLIVLTKLDLLTPGQALPTIRAPEARGILAISSVTGRGIEELKEYLWELVEEAKASAPTETLEDV